jgi:Caspase domain/Jacalin-like lectin domain
MRFSFVFPICFFATQAMAAESCDDKPTGAGGMQQVHQSASTGGAGGTAFNDARACISHFPITRITIGTNLNPADQRQMIIGALQVEWGSARGEMHGGRGPLAQPSTSVELKPGEVIRKVEINSKTYNFPANPPPVWVAGLRIVTSKSSYTFGDPGSGHTTVCTVPNGEALVGFYGRGGSYIDRLGCITASQTNEVHQPVADDARPPGAASPAAANSANAVAAIIDHAPSFGKRVALVIGNSNYQNAPALPNPQRDAATVASSLEKVGFQKVTLETNLGREQIVGALRIFAKEAENADWAVVYYAGHGIEAEGINYLIPIDAKINTDRDIGLEAVPIGQVLNSAEQARALRLVILDACRDNPFANQMKRTLTAASRSVSRGLAQIEPDPGTLVIFAAKAGETALDGDGGNSPFVTAFVRDIQVPGVEVRRLFDNVRDDVMDMTGRRQQPYSYGSVPGRQDFYFTLK